MELKGAIKKVSIVVITYKHEKFIRQTLDSIVSQKTNFDFELIIAEDFSPDKTRSICEEFAEQYPAVVRLLPSERNYGAMANFIRAIYACTGKYIAMCEGDDYWIDDHKLQKQFDFMEANPDFTLCFTGVEVIDEMGWNKDSTHFWPNPVKDEFTIEDVILSEMSIAPTPTIFFRNVLPNPLPDFYAKALAGDMGIQLFAAEKGKLKYLPGKMAVYRNHSGGMTKTKESIEKGNTALLKFFMDFNEYSGYRYADVFRKRFLANAKTQLIFGARDKKGIGRLQHYFKRMPDYLKYSNKVDLKEFIYFHVILFAPFILKLFPGKNDRQ